MAAENPSAKPYSGPERRARDRDADADVSRRLRLLAAGAVVATAVLFALIHWARLP